MAPINALEHYLSVHPAHQLRANCDDDPALLSMAAQGIGVAAMPQLRLQDPPPEVRVLELTPPVKRVLGVALPNSPTKEAIRFCPFSAPEISLRRVLSRRPRRKAVSTDGDDAVFHFKVPAAVSESS